VSAISELGDGRRLAAVTALVAFGQETTVRTTAIGFQRWLTDTKRLRGESVSHRAEL
jgi:hypothetical protein